MCSSPVVVNEILTYDFHLQIMVDGLARVLCMRSEIASDEQRDNTHHTSNADGSHHSRHSKERKKNQMPKVGV